MAIPCSPPISALTDVAPEVGLSAPFSMSDPIIVALSDDGALPYAMSELLCKSAQPPWQDVLDLQPDVFVPRVDDAVAYGGVLWQDDAGTVPAAAPGDPVRNITDLGAMGVDYSGDLNLQINAVGDALEAIDPAQKSGAYPYIGAQSSLHTLLVAGRYKFRGSDFTTYLGGDDVTVKTGVLIKEINNKGYFTFGGHSVEYSRRADSNDVLCIGGHGNTFGRYSVYVNGGYMQELDPGVPPQLSTVGLAGSASTNTLNGQEFIGLFFKASGFTADKHRIVGEYLAGL